MGGSKGNVLCRDLRHNALVAGSLRGLAPQPGLSASEIRVAGAAGRGRSRISLTLDPRHEAEGVAQWTMCRFGVARALRR
jgi:hypothetical protein